MTQEEISKQLYDKVLASAEQFKQDLKKLLHEGTYKLGYQDRNWQTGKVENAGLSVGDFHIALTKGHLNIGIPKFLGEGFIDNSLLESWDKQTLERDIKNCKDELEALLKRKEELSMES